MSYLDAVILGLIQGLTEFLPVSSSGHLVLAQELLGVNLPGVSFEVLTHLGTLLAVLLFFRERIIDLIRSLFVKSMLEERRIIVLLIIGTIPAVIVGLLLKDSIEEAFTSPVLASSMLIATGAILLATRFVPKKQGEVSTAKSIIIGIGQALAILPGISRSGTTIATGMFLGVDPGKAAEFSFLLAIPAIGGATVLELNELAHTSGALLGRYAVGALAAFISGLLAVYLVMAAVRRGRFEYFGYYCLAAGLVGLYLFV